MQRESAAFSAAVVRRSAAPAGSSRPRRRTDGAVPAGAAVCASTVTSRSPVDGPESRTVSPVNSPMSRNSCPSRASTRLKPSWSPSAAAASNTDAR